jgi:arginase family enzyme
VDVLDPAEMSAKQPLTPGVGLTFPELRNLLTALMASPRVVALEVVEFSPDRDPDGVLARQLVDLLAEAVGRRFRR